MCFWNVCIGLYGKVSKTLAQLVILFVQISAEIRYNRKAHIVSNWNSRDQFWNQGICSLSLSFVSICFQVFSNLSS